MATPPPSGGEGSKTRLLVVGAGEAGQSLVRQIQAEDLPVRPVAFLDDDPGLIGRQVCGLPVLGGTVDLPAVARKVGAEEILIAIPSSGGALIRRLVILCRRAEPVIGDLVLVSDTS